MWRGIEYHIVFKRRRTSRSWAMIPSSPIQKYSLVFQYAVELWSGSSLNLAGNTSSGCQATQKPESTSRTHGWSEGTQCHEECFNRDAQHFYCTLLLPFYARKMGLVWISCLDFAKAILLKLTTDKNSYLFCCLVSLPKKLQCSQHDPCGCLPAKDIVRFYDSSMWGKFS